MTTPTRIPNSRLAPCLDKAVAYEVKDVPFGGKEYYVRFPESCGSTHLAHVDFYGKGNNFYEEVVVRSSTSEDGRGNILEGDRRIARDQHNDITILYADSNAILTCTTGSDAETFSFVTVKRLVPLKGKARSVLLGRANFFAHPIVDEPTYLAQFPDGRYVVVTSTKREIQKGTGSSKEWRIFVGSSTNPPSARELPITAIEAEPPNFTLTITTSEGVVVFPHPLCKEKSHPTFKPVGSEQTITLSNKEVSEHQETIGQLQLPLRNGGVADPSRFVCDPLEIEIPPHEWPPIIECE